MTRLHATCVALPDPTAPETWSGVLLLGASGAGKSDLALRLIDAGARLVADDQVLVTPGQDGPIARAPDALKGLIEVRGMGVIRLAPLPSAIVRLACAPETAAEAERLPARRVFDTPGGGVDLFGIDYSSPAAAARVRLALQATRLGLFVE